MEDEETKVNIAALLFAHQVNGNTLSREQSKYIADFINKCTPLDAEFSNAIYADRFELYED
jgi:elongation factor P--beta-lysine ligase